MSDRGPHGQYSRLQPSASLPLYQDSDTCHTVHFPVQELLYSIRMGNAPYAAWSLHQLFKEDLSASLVS